MRAPAADSERTLPIAVAADDAGTTVKLPGAAWASPERDEENWPLERTDYRPLYLNAADGTLAAAAPARETSVATTQNRKTAPPPSSTSSGKTPS